MAGKNVISNPLVITGKTPDTSLNVQLHPLVLLTISDYITRHTIRKQAGPVVGAVLGQQNGRSFTMEVAFECKLADKAEGALLDADWFSERLEMYKEVHKDPALDFVAIFTLGPVEGPQDAHLQLLRQMQTITSSDSIMLLLFHTQLVDNLQGGNLPISLYESVEEIENDEMQTRFREMTFEVETSDAEMISVDFVAKGGANATAVPKAETLVSAGSASAADKKKGKGKGKAKESEDMEGAPPSSILSSEDDELIASLTAKVNAIKMLNERINLIRSYLTTLPPSYLTDASLTTPPPATTNFQLLRSASAMLSRVPLLAPPSSSTAQADPGSTSTPLATNLQQASDREKQDVHLTSLLASLTRSITEAQSMGSKLSIVQREKTSRERSQGFGRGGRIGGLGDGGILADEGH